MKCDEIIAAYFETIKEGVSCKPMPNGRLSIVLPFLYPDHDNVEVFVKEESANTVIVSDLGETMRRLDMIGLDTHTSSTIAYQVERISSGLQVSMEDGILFKEGNRNDIGSLLFDVVSACTAVGDLAFGSRGFQPLTFQEEVATLLKSNDLSFDRGHTVRGRSTREYKIDFMVTTRHRVSYVHALSAQTRGGILAWVNATFAMWSDIETAQEKVTRKVSLLNSETDKIVEGDVNLLGQVSTVFRWTEQGQFLSSLRNGSTTSEPHASSPV
jgi:hypothetical protein